MNAKTLNLGHIPATLLSFCSFCELFFVDGCGVSDFSFVSIGSYKIKQLLLISKWKWPILLHGDILFGTFKVHSSFETGREA